MSPNVRGGFVWGMGVAAVLWLGASAMGEMVERRYPVREIAGFEEDEEVAQEMVDELIILIVSTIDPDAWVKADGGNDDQYRIHDSEEVLVIVAPEAVQDRIGGMLRHLRMTRLTRIPIEMRVLVMEEGEVLERWNRKLGEKVEGRKMRGAVLSEEEVEALLGEASLQEESVAVRRNGDQWLMGINKERIEVNVAAVARQDEVIVRMNPRGRVDDPDTARAAAGELGLIHVPDVHGMTGVVIRIPAEGAALFGGFDIARQEDAEGREWVVLVTASIVRPDGEAAEGP